MITSIQNVALPKLMKEVVKANKILYIYDLSPESLKELQTVLKGADYYQGNIDGIYGKKTLAAFRTFKKEAYLSRVTEIGPSTVAALERLADKATLTEQETRKPPVINKYAGQHTGASAIIPGGTRVHSNEYIVNGVPLTWGEMTKDLSRIPHSEQVVKNILLVARKFGKIRRKFGQPLRINSGYRPPHLKIGATYSQHKVGKAIDISPMNSKDLQRLWKVCVASDTIGLGDGKRRGFVHCDWRSRSRRVVFGY